MPIPGLAVVGGFFSKIISGVTTAALKFWGVFATAKWFSERAERKRLQHDMEIKDKQLKAAGKPRADRDAILKRMRDGGL